MKTVLVSIGLCLAATAVHSMPLSLLNANRAQPVIASPINAVIAADRPVRM